MTPTIVMVTVIAAAIAILATLILKVRKTMINCKTCRNTKNCVYAGADREMEECVDRIPTTHSDIIRSMTDDELAKWLYDMQGYSFSCGLIEARISEYPNRYNAWLKWLREEVEA